MQGPQTIIFPLKTEYLVHDKLGLQLNLLHCVYDRMSVDERNLVIDVWDTRFSLLDWVRVAGLSCTKGVWYIYDWDTGWFIWCVEAHALRALIV